MIACLFLSSAATAQDWSFAEKERQAYEWVLDLRLDEARALLGESPATADGMYVISLSETLELLITEDAVNKTEFEKHFERRIRVLQNNSDAKTLFVQAELYLQWAFVYLKFGNEFEAVQSIRDAYRVAAQCRKKNPRFTPIKKTSGLLDVMIGAVPEKYNWVLSLLRLEGSVQRGLASLETSGQSGSSIAFESRILLALAQSYILQAPSQGMAAFEKLLDERKGSRLLSFLAASVAMKNSQGERALSLLQSLNTDQQGLSLFYAEYLRGESLLHKGDYANAISAYQLFLDKYQGENYVKDAHYKIGLCHWLNGHGELAGEKFDEALHMGRHETEADKHAARSLSDPHPPNIKLSKVRYFTDGGYYDEAATLLGQIDPSDLPLQRDRVEFYYRKARLHHKQNQYGPARLFYEQTIDMAGEEAWYFAPNACLQTGYILQENGDIARAREFFQKAMRYRDHEYKNSIDTKAKSALDQLKRK